jgi:hypothetical protein
MPSDRPRYKCYNCGEELVFEVKIGRRDMCPNCFAYLHCCYNCKFYNPDVHNQCTENQGEFIRDRAEGNFCLYFTFKEVGEEDPQDEARKAKQRLEAMFGQKKSSEAPKTPEEAKARLEALFKKD